MKLQSLPVFVSTIVLLTACGGGSGSNNTANGSIPATSSSKASSQPASSSSAASSKAPELGCAYYEGAVYMDAACSPWQSPSVREKNTDGSIGQEVDAKQSQALSLVELDIEDSAHQRVIDVHYNKAGAPNSQLRFGISGTSGIDLSAYQTGKLVFDLKVITNGDHNAPLQIALDCGWPCESTEKNIEIGALNKWQTIELPIADFVRDGLNIKQVRSGLQIMPGLNQQTNAHFQLDNIRWEKGQSTQPVAKSCYSHHFDSTTSTSLILRSFSGDKLPTVIGEVPASIIKPEWSNPQERWGYGEQTLNLDEACLTNPESTFSASVYIPGAYVTDGKLLVGFYFADADNNYTTAGMTRAGNLQPDSWNIIEGKLPQAQSKTRAISAKQAANKAGFSHWGIVFDANGKDPAVTGELRIDNIVVSQNPATSSSSVSQNLSSASNSVTTSAIGSSSSAISSHTSSSVVIASSSQLLTSSSSSSIQNSGCTAGSGSYSGSAPLGFGIAINSVAYLRIELDNGKFIGLPNVTIPNASLTTASSNDSTVILQITAPQFLSSSTMIDLSVDYQQLDANLKVSHVVKLYSTLADAVNHTNVYLSSSTDNIAAACSFSSRSSSSSGPTTSSSAPLASSSSSNVAASSITSSTTTSTVSSVASSTATSQASSSAGCSAASGSYSDSQSLGFGLPSGSVGFLKIDLINGKFIGSPGVSIANASLNVAMSNDSMFIFQISASQHLSNSTAIDISLDYQQQNATQKVSRSVMLYSTLAHAVNGVNALSGSSTDIANPACP